MSNSELVKVYNLAIRALAQRARSVAEIRAKLSALPAPAKGKAHEVEMGFVDATIVEEVISKLLSQNLLNDQEFARGYIRYQLSLRPLGERALSFRLHHLGVDQQTIKSALREAFAGPEATLELARRALGNRSFDSPKLQAKAVRFLASRGFSYSTIKALIDASRQKE